MSNIIIDKNKIDLLANAISVKSGEPLTLTLDEMVTAVDGIEPALQTKTKIYTPTESQQMESVTADSGYDGLDEVDITVGAISPTYVGSGITRRSSSNLTASGSTVTVPAGYYSSQASKSVTSGTAGTPSATKGSVSNHSVSVTPSVTNTTGYITGSTKTGTAVSVSASELVSGSETKTVNGTYDVTNLAELVVNVPAQSAEYTGTISRSDGQTIPRVTVNSAGTAYSANGATFNWTDNDTLDFYLGSSDYDSYVFFNGALKYWMSGGHFIFTPPACDMTIEFYRNYTDGKSYVFINSVDFDIFPIFKVTRNSSGNITSVSCNKTYEEVLALWDFCSYAAIIIDLPPSDTVGSNAGGIWSNDGNLLISWVAEGMVQVDFTYNSDGTISW